MHHVHAEIAGARDAGQRVHIGAVHVKQGAAFVEDRGDFGDALFEDSQRAGIGDHQRGDVVGDEFAEMIGIDLAAAIGFDVLHFVAGDDDGGGIGAVRGIGDQDFVARVALAFEIGANHQQAGEFALRAGGGLQRGGVHAGDREQAFLQIVKDAQAALGDFAGLFGMFGGEAFEARDEFVDARVVFHGAGAERVHAQIDRVIPGGKAGEVADHFDFADFGEAFDGIAREGGAERGGGVDRRDVERRQFHAALAGSGMFEDQPFVLADVRARFADVFCGGFEIGELSGSKW